MRRSQGRKARALVLAVVGALALLSLGVPFATAVVNWSGDFSTGDLSQWTVTSRDALPGRITVTNNAPGFTGYEGRFDIEPNDPSPNPNDPDKQRAEVRATQAQTEGYPGAQVWYGWSVYFPNPGFTSPDVNPNTAHPQTIFTQWKRNDGACGSPNALFEVANATAPGLFLGVRGGINQKNDATCTGTTYNSYRLARFTRGRWYRFVFHVRWSSNSHIGFVEAWVNGVKVLPKTYHATLYRDADSSTDYGVHLKQGEYRRFSPDNGSVLYIAQTRVGTSYAAVAP